MKDLYSMSVEEFKAYLAELQAAPCPECGKVEAPATLSFKDLLESQRTSPPTAPRTEAFSKADMDAFLTSLYLSDAGPSCPGCQTKHARIDALVFARLPYDMQREAPELWQAMKEQES